MEPYIELNAHHIGKSHIQNSLDCEDYSATYSDELISVVVISDGHGDKNCFRSKLGAKYACDVSINLCRQFQRITGHIDDISDCNFDELVASLEAEIVARWREKVLLDAQNHPFSLDEISKASEQAQAVYKEGKRLEKAYGCTLIVAMSTVSFWLAVQIGDGKCIAAYRDGVFVEPIPIDENCLGNRSTSLCNSNAKDSFRHYYSKTKPAAIFVSSDGVEESFDQSGLYNCFYSIAFWIKEEGRETALKKLNELLPQISEGGSGDDVSLAAMVSSVDEIVAPRQALEQVYERVNSYANALDQCTVKLEEVKGSLESKINRRDALEKEIAELKATLQEKEGAFDLAAGECQQLSISAAELTEKVQHAAEQMEKAEKYKASAEKYWFSEFEKLDIKYKVTTETEPYVSETGETDFLPQGKDTPASDEAESLSQAENEPPAIERLSTEEGKERR